MTTEPTLKDLEAVFGNWDIPISPTIRKYVLRYIKTLRRKRALRGAATRRRHACAAVRRRRDRSES